MPADLPAWSPTWPHTDGSHGPGIVLLSGAVGVSQGIYQEFYGEFLGIRVILWDKYPGDLSWFFILSQELLELYVDKMG